MGTLWSGRRKKGIMWLAGLVIGLMMSGVALGFACQVNENIDSSRCDTQELNASEFACLLASEMYKVEYTCSDGCLIRNGASAGTFVYSIPCKWGEVYGGKKGCKGNINGAQDVRCTVSGYESADGDHLLVKERLCKVAAASYCSKTEPIKAITGGGASDISGQPPGQGSQNGMGRPNGSKSEPSTHRK
jgi:hypothetical protein